MNDRLHWQRDGTGFVAYPEGEDKPTICAQMFLLRAVPTASGRRH